MVESYRCSKDPLCGQEKSSALELNSGLAIWVVGVDFGWLSSFWGSVFFVVLRAPSCMICS